MDSSDYRVDKVPDKEIRCQGMCAASAIIPSFVTGSEAAFGEIVDALYFLLYEGAGGTKNRLTDIVPDEVLAPLWQLKHLRLHYRHDIEHGDDRDIKKKYEKIARAFRSLCGRDLPSRPGDCGPQ